MSSLLITFEVLKFFWKGRELYFEKPEHIQRSKSRLTFPSCYCFIMVALSLCVCDSFCGYRYIIYFLFCF